MANRTLSRLALLALAPVLSTACVTKGTHQTALDSLADARARQAATEADMRAQQESLERELAQERADRAADVERLEQRLAEMRSEAAETEARRARAEARFEEARDEVYRVETLLEARGTENQQLERRLRALRDIEQEVRQRNQIYEQVIGRFRSLIDEGRVSVAIDRGRLVIQLPQDILFASGSATLGSEGRQTLLQVGDALAGIDDRSFQVEGHTDNVPISTGEFPSNWELSTARALSVVRVLVRQGVAPERISGAGYAEFQPVAPNDTPANRRLNRRIEIVMLPNLDLIAETEVPGS